MLAFFYQHHGSVMGYGWLWYSSRRRASGDSGGGVTTEPGGSVANSDDSVASGKTWMTRRLGRIWQDLDDSSENHGCTRPGKPGKSLRTWKWRRNVVDIPWFSHENSMVDLSIVFCQRLPEGKHQNISISNWIGDQKICKFATGQSKHE